MFVPHRSVSFDLSTVVFNSKIDAQRLSTKIYLGEILGEIQIYYYLLFRAPELWRTHSRSTF